MHLLKPLHQSEARRNLVDRRAKAACLCLYCCNLHVWFYDRVRLGRLEIATLGVDARAKEGKGEGEGKGYLSSAPSRAAQDSPYFLLSFGVSTRRFGEKKHSRARRKREKENTTWGRAWQSNGRKKALRSRSAYRAFSLTWPVDFKFAATKESVYIIRKEFISHRTPTWPPF